MGGRTDRSDGVLAAAKVGICRGFAVQNCNSSCTEGIAVRAPPARRERANRVLGPSRGPSRTADRLTARRGPTGGPTARRPDRPRYRVEPSDDQTSIFVRTRPMTSEVNSLVEACPPRSGVRTPAALASSTAS